MNKVFIFFTIVLLQIGSAVRSEEHQPPISAEMFLNAVTAVEKKDFVKAAELMEEVIDMVPGEVISLDHLGDIYFAMNRKREATFFWKQARDLATPEDKIIEKIDIKLRKYNDS